MFGEWAVRRYGRDESRIRAGARMGGGLWDEVSARSGVSSPSPDDEDLS